MLHNEARKLLVEGYEATHNAEAIAKIFHVNKYTVYHLEERKRKTGSVDLQTWRRGRKALLSSTDKARIAECITKNPTINLEELRTQLGLKVSISTMSRVVRALGFRVKKVGLSATERERPRCAGKTYQVERVKAPPHNSAARLAMPFPPSAACKFLDLPPVNLRNLHLHLTKNPFASRPPHLCGVTLKLAIEHWRLVFLGKSSENIGMTRRYGRAIGKARVHGSAPLNVPTSQTVLASVRLNGQITYTMYPGGTSGERFLDYLKNVLIPTLHKGDIIVMDNMRSHHVKGVEEVLRAAGMIPLYLPPYSPDLNPIEMLWSKMKAILRKLGCNIAALLPQMVAEALALVSPEDCFGWFTADGY